MQKELWFKANFWLQMTVKRYFVLFFLTYKKSI